MPRRRKSALHKPLISTKTFRLATTALVILGGMSFVPKKYQGDLLRLATGLGTIAAVTARHGAGEASREAAGEEQGVEGN